MILTKIEIFQAPLKLKKPFVISLSTHHFAENIFVKLTDSEGFVGYGECCPFKSINGEYMTSAFEIGKILAENLLNKEIQDTEKLHQILDASIFGNSSIKSAFDIAFYDILAQKVGIPLYKYLGGNSKKKF